MANTVKGKVYEIEPIVTNEYNGKTYEKRGIILDCSTYDQYSGNPIPNFIRIEFSGLRPTGELEKVQIGQFVEVSFMVKGTMYADKNTGEMKNFTSIRGYKVDVLSSAPVTTPQEQPHKTAPVEATPAARTADVRKEGDDLPF